MMARNKELMTQGLEVEAGLINPSDEAKRMWRILGGLGSHDISVMREAFGMPTAVQGASCGWPFWK
jgi:hypothetical protein